MEINPLLVTMFAIIFFHFEGCLHLVYSFLCCAETFKFYCVPCVYFCFYFLYPFNITVIQGCAPTSNAEEAEVEWFNEDLQDLLELTPKNDVLFIIRDWNEKIEVKKHLE